MSSESEGAKKILDPQAEGWPIGHYYSAVPDFPRLKLNREAILEDRDSIPGIELNVSEQVALMERLRGQIQHFDWPETPHPSRRYHTSASIFGIGSAFFLFAMLKTFKPNRVIEVGSGFSSAVMLDTVEHHPDVGSKLTFIEPEPTRLRRLLRDTDSERFSMIVDFVQNVHLDTFRELQSGDVLFIDSSHVAKTGSDVLFLYNEVIPILASGVIIHIHDIYWPFEYPRSWILDQQWGWNEAYFLRSMLQHSSKLEILLFCNYLAKRHRSLFEGIGFPPGSAGSSIWLRNR